MDRVTTIYFVGKNRDICENLRSRFRHNSKSCKNCKLIFDPSFELKTGNRHKIFESFAKKMGSTPPTPLKFAFDQDYTKYVLLRYSEQPTHDKIRLPTPQKVRYKKMI
jgi:hypothetical protein